MKLALTHLLVLSLSLTVCAQTPDTSALTKVGQAVPDFTVTTLDGKVMKTSDLKGKVVLLRPIQKKKYTASSRSSISRETM